MVSGVEGNMNTTEFCTKHGIEMEYEESEPREGWAPGSMHWSCTLRFDGREMTVPFSQGSAICREPQVDEVLDCLAGDSFAGELSFEQFCDEYGYSTDSRHAHATWEECRGIERKLAVLLGSEELVDKLYEAERL